MKRLRQAHLFLGVFFTPMLVFFIGTGWYQTVNIERLKSTSEAETLVQKLRVVHTDQIYPGDTEIRKPSSPKLSFKKTEVVVPKANELATARGWVRVSDWFPEPISTTSVELAEFQEPLTVRFW